MFLMSHNEDSYFQTLKNELEDNEMHKKFISMKIYAIISSKSGHFKYVTLQCFEHQNGLS